MENDLTMKLNEVLLWISVIIMCAMSYFLNEKYSIVAIFWIIIIISMGNAKRIYSTKYPIISIILRRSMYIIPFFLPLFTTFKINISNNSNIIVWCIFSCIIGSLFILPKYNEWIIVFSREMIEFSNKKDSIDYFTQIFLLIVVAIGEEIFFRNFVIGYIDNIHYFFSILLSCYLFFLNHFGVKWNFSFSLYDYTIQIFFSIVSSFLFITSKSILPSICVHIVYNLPLIILECKCYFYHYYINKE